MAVVAAFPLAQRVTVPLSHWDGDLAVDLFAPCGTPWVAMFDGTCRPADYPLGGHTVTLHGDSGIDAYYAHGRADGRASGRVRAGDVIGYLSNTGNANKRHDGVEHADECHLHLAIGDINANGAGSIAPWEVLGEGRVVSAPATVADDLSLVAAASSSGAPWWAVALGGVAVLWAIDVL